MSNRIFQSVVLQMKDCTDRAIGVIDSEGTVIACNVLTSIGERWPDAASALDHSEQAVCAEGKTFQKLSALGAQFDYAAFAVGEDAMAMTLCSMAAVALTGSVSTPAKAKDSPNKSPASRRPIRVRLP